MNHKEREQAIGEIMWYLIESKDERTLSEYLNNPMKEPEEEDIELVERYYLVQRRTAKEWLSCAIYQLRQWSDIHEGLESYKEERGRAHKVRRYKK